MSHAAIVRCALFLLTLLLADPVSSQNICNTPEGIPGDCRSLYNCPHILSQIQGPLSAQQSNYLRSLQCPNGNGQFPHVCCTFNNFFQPQPLPITWIPKPQIPISQIQPQSRPIQPFFHSGQNRRTNLNPIRNQNQIPNNQPGTTRLNAINGKNNNKSIQGIGSGGSVLPGVGICGLTGLANRIFGGESTQLDDYPWMALLEYQPRNRRERKLSCGGSLINTRYVLTAAHCLVGEIENRVGVLVGVRLGEYDITKEVDCLGNTCADPVKYLGVEKIIPHHGYNKRDKNRLNDIGLIRLNDDVTYTDYIRPVCLPWIANSARTAPNEQLFSAGWGRTITSRQSATKQQVALPFSDHYYCQNKYQALGITVTDNQLCAGGIYGSDTCDGDSGNGLLKVAANSWVIEGIVSYGRECGLPEWPAVYTKVSNYQNWIIRNLES